MQQSKTGRRRGPYKRRFHQPLFPELLVKTTTPEGRRTYGKLYMRRTRLLDGCKR